MLYFGKVLSFLFLPPGIFILLFLAGFIFMFFERRNKKIIIFSRICLITGVGLFILLSLSPVADLLILPLENGNSALPRLENLSSSDYSGATIVILGAGNIDGSLEEGFGSSPSTHAAKRIAYGARLSRALDLDVIFSGGIVYKHEGGESEALAALRYLQGLGIPNFRISVDSTSKSTWENAENVAKIFAAKKSKPKIILVTSAFHMTRAVLCFKKQGIEVIPAPTDYLSSRVPYTWESWFPDTGALEKSGTAIHEYLGIFVLSFTQKNIK